MRSGIFERLMAGAQVATFSPVITEEGKVLSAGDGVARISGPTDARLYELLEFERGGTGIVFDLDRTEIGVIMLCGVDEISAGDRVFSTGRVASIDAGEWLLGRVVNPLGSPLDGGPGNKGRPVPCPIERAAPGLVQRDPVTRPLYTGLKVIDAMIPIGRGQRELILGDQSTGKTSIVVDAIINQKASGVVCVYAAIGQKKSRVLRTIETVRKYGEMRNTVFVVADASDAIGLQYITPYSATAVAEYFLDRGRDVLVVYDDLTRHAEAYRSLCLLLRRVPGREAFPGDVFFLHSRLLERSACLNDAAGGGSITSLPIVETQEGRISSFIPTNLISITDGQIYLDTALFNKGIRPAVDVGKSVSRIGGNAQTEAMKTVARSMKIEYSRFLELEVFTKFGAHVEEETRRTLRRGQCLREVLKQPRFHPVGQAEQVLGFIVLDTGVLDALPPGTELEAAGRVVKELLGAFPRVVEMINEEGSLTKAQAESVESYVRDMGIGEQWLRS